MIRGRSALLAVLFVLVVTARLASQTASPSAEWLLDQVKILSSPPMEGRRSGTGGGNLAAAHIARVFKDAGLRPGGDAGDYLHAFQVPTGIRLGAVNVLSVTAPSARTLVLDKDWRPLAVSTDGRAAADLVFAGYGITAPDLQYDDYAGIEVRDKVVLVLTGEPRGRDPSSPFRKPEAYHYSERRHKIINAREHGARAVLLVAHPSVDKDTLPELRGLSQPWGILAAAITRTVADTLLAPSGKPFNAVAAEIDQALAPRSFEVTGVKVSFEVSLVRERGSAPNVIGIVPGTDPRLKDEAIVIGAHYDHLGRGGEGSLAPDQVGAIHPGADDNASGTTGVMGLAREFAASGGLPRTLVFVAFAGEELGLLGSSEYIRRPPWALDKTVFMLNLDMIGRLRNGKLYVAGVDSGQGLRAIATDAARGLPLSPEIRSDPYAPSDHTAFYTAGCPVIFLFTGAHDDYHRPTDTWEKIDGAGLATVTSFASRLIAAVARERVPPAYVKILVPVSSSRTRGGYGPVLGVVPDFSDAQEPGVRITGVRAGSPAEKAGLQAGDVIVGLAGVSVKTLDDLTFALRARRAGDQVDVRFVRDGREQHVKATLEERR